MRADKTLEAIKICYTCNKFGTTPAIANPVDEKSF